MMFNLVLNPSMYLSLPGGKLALEYYYKHNRKNCFREVASIARLLGISLDIIFYFSVILLCPLRLLVTIFLNSQNVTLVIFILVRKRNDVFGVFFSIKDLFIIQGIYIYQVDRIRIKTFW